MRRLGLPQGITLLVWLLSCWRVASLWSALPGTMASHYGPSGVPDGWMGKAAFLGTVLTINAVIIGLLSALPLTLRGVPDKLVNLPNREYWLAPERRAATLARLGQHLAWLGCLTAIFLAYTLELTLRANLRDGPLDYAAMMSGLVLFILATLVFAVSLYRAFRVPS